MNECKVKHMVTTDDYQQMTPNKQQQHWWTSVTVWELVTCHW